MRLDGALSESFLSGGSRGGAQSIPTSPRSQRGDGMRAGDSKCPAVLPWDRHWSQNPAALEIMKPMNFFMKAPPLKVKMTQFHGTRVPMLMVFFLTTSELERLARADMFWQRIAKHSATWRALSCRDFDARGCVASGRCACRALRGRTETCLFHARHSHPADFIDQCARITAIPGRSKQELTEAYKSWWHQKRKDAIRRGLLSRGVTSLVEELESSPDDAAPLPPPQKDALEVVVRWPVAAHSTFGLSLKHHKRPSTKTPSPVKPVSRMRHSERAGSPRPLGAQRAASAAPVLRDTDLVDSLRQPLRGFTTGPCSMALPPLSGSSRRRGAASCRWQDASEAGSTAVCPAGSGRGGGGPRPAVGGWAASPCRLGQVLGGCLAVPVAVRQQLQAV